MYILGENPAMSDPDVDHARDALAKLEHLVVQDIFLTETANFADVILPALLARKDRHRHQHQPPGSDGPPCGAPPGEAREDWAITLSLPSVGSGLDLHASERSFAEMKQSDEVAGQHHVGTSEYETRHLPIS